MVGVGASVVTPGPWTLEEPSKGFDGYIIHGGPTWAELATVRANGETDHVADAHLIAEAPAMVEALRRIAEHESRADRRHRGMVDVEEVAGLRLIARVALTRLEREKDTSPS